MDVREVGSQLRRLAGEGEDFGAHTLVYVRAEEIFTHAPAVYAAPVDLTPGRALLLSRTAHSPRADAPPFAVSERTLAREGGLVAGAAVLMAIATTANVIRHWNDGRR